MQATVRTSSAWPKQREQMSRLANIASTSLDFSLSVGHDLLKQHSSTCSPWPDIDSIREIETRSESDTRIALHMQVRVNNSPMKPVYETPAFGKDNGIARHGIHGLYALYNIHIPAADLQKGGNIIYLNQRKASGPFNGT
ncbi:hypothetical protein Mapa_014640 [Marchantia paleacea]|nr:hypothetical protein Mapa_014640 [Marchantia paleacea]